MLTSTEAGLLAQLLVFLPLKSDRGFGVRWGIRTLLLGLVVYHIVRRLWRGRGSTRSNLPGAFALAFVYAVLLTPSFVETSTYDWDLDSYNHLLLLVIEVAFAIVFCVRQIFKITVAVPGPFLAKFTSLWKVYHLFRGTYGRTLIDLHRRYGNVVRVGPYEYSIGSYSVLPTSGLSQSLWGTLSHRTLELLVASQLYLGHYSAYFETMAWQAPDYELVVDECNKVLLHTLTEYANHEKPVHLAKLVCCYAWDTMGATTVGKRFGFMDMSENVTTLIDRVENWKFHAILHGTILRFHPWLTAIVKQTMLRNATESDCAVLSRIVQERLRPHLFEDAPSPDSPQGTIWDALKHKSTFFAGFDDEKAGIGNELSHCAVALMLVGGDPIARHIISTIYHLSCNEKVVQKLRCELEELDTPLSTPPSLEELNAKKFDLPYLYAVLRESRRLEGTADGMDFSKTTFATDDALLVGDHRIPAECTVRLHTAAANRDSMLGQDMDLFVPDRWVAPVTSQVFAFGDSLFSGSEDSQRALVAKIIVQVVQQFDITLSNPTTSGSTTDMAHAKAQFSIVPNLAKQLATAGIHSTSPMADHVGCIRRHMGTRFVTVMLEARGSEETAAAPIYATLHGLQSAPILDNNKRRPLHQAIRAVSKGGLDSKTELSNNCVTIGPVGFSDFRPRDRERDDRSSRSGGGRDRGRGRGRGRRRGRDNYNGRSNSNRQGGHTGNQSLSSETANSHDSGQKSASTSPHVRDAREGRLPPPAGTIPSKIDRTSDWSNFSSIVAEQDRAESAAASKRIEDFATEQKVQGTKGVSTFKKTCIVNGKRTLVDTFKNGESINGGVAVPEPELEKVRAPLLIPEGYIPPHKRGKAAAGNHVISAENRKDGDVVDAKGGTANDHGGIELKHKEKPQGGWKKANDQTKESKSKINGLKAGLDITAGNRGNETKGSHETPHATLGARLKLPGEFSAATE